MFERREEIRLQQLPAGRVRQGFLNDSKYNLLDVEMEDAEHASGLDAGSLVEVDCERTLYLGEVYSRHGTHLVIAAHHAVDREALADIQEVWNLAGRR